MVVQFTYVYIRKDIALNSYLKYKLITQMQKQEKTLKMLPPIHSSL